MSAFDDWRNEMHERGEITGPRKAWHAVLDQLEVLAEGWKESDQGDPLGQGKCANELIARIKELGETT